MHIYISVQAFRVLYRWMEGYKEREKSGGKRFMAGLRNNPRLQLISIHNHRITRVWILLRGVINICNTRRSLRARQLHPKRCFAFPAKLPLVQVKALQIQLDGTYRLWLWGFDVSSSDIDIGPALICDSIQVIALKINAVLGEFEMGLASPTERPICAPKLGLPKDGT
jgi:hypothetical protein